MYRLIYAFDVDIRHVRFLMAQLKWHSGITLGTLQRANCQFFFLSFQKRDTIATEGTCSRLLVKSFPYYEVIASAPDFGSRGLSFESRWRQDSFRTLTVLHCTEPFMFTLPSSWYDWNTAERDVKLQNIYPSISQLGIGCINCSMQCFT